MEASEKLTIQALKAHDKVHPKFKTAGKSLKQKSRASLLSSPEEPSEVIYFCLVNHKIEKKNPTVNVLKFPYVIIFILVHFFLFIECLSFN